MNIGKTIRSIREKENMSQEAFGELFFVTRQTVSNWENEKSYPDLQTLVKISDKFSVSLDSLIKEDKQMITSVSATFHDGLKIKCLKKWLLSVLSIILAGTMLAFLCYTGMYLRQKDKLETQFLEQAQTYGFTLTEEGVYQLTQSKTLSYYLPNQKMPSFWDFNLSFHAMHLDAYLSAGNDTIWIRFSDSEEIAFCVQWHESIPDSDFYLLQEDGTVANADCLPESVQTMYHTYQSEIAEAVMQGNRIYQAVYR